MLSSISRKYFNLIYFLNNYNPALDIVLAGDAWNTAMKATIMHYLPNGKIKTTGSTSRTLMTSEQNYSQLKKKALILVFEGTKFHRMLLDRHFKLQTDQQPLLKFIRAKKGIPLIVYRAGHLLH